MTKPPYRVPSMAEIATMPYNGYDVVSTFSGCGGGCLGLRMAGFRVRWANEFVEAAALTYEANRHDSLLSRADVRTVSPKEILRLIGKKEGELDLLEGSPPCAAFSMAGKREEHWGQVKKYSDTKQRVDDLFFEYIRLLRGLRPKMFVAENVAGLVRGVAKGYFKEILAEMKASGYVVRAAVVNAKWLGVPQDRQRLIYIGVREDLGVAPEFPKPLGYFYSLRDALPWLGSVGSKWGGHNRKAKDHPVDEASPAIVTAPNKSGFVVSGRTGPGWSRREHSVEQPFPTVIASDPAHTRYEIQTKQRRRSVDEPAPTVQTHGRRGTESEMTLVGPSLAGYTIEAEWDRLKLGESSDKYFNLSKPHPDKASPTITATGGSSPGTAGVTHPYEKRKFSIAELKRICSFPDDFVLTGTYSQQWERCGRAVPPMMYYHLGLSIRRTLDRIAGGDA